ncbi:hypothetical protein, partial [Streptomyces viridosporus]|uniref:hypothetical protein n=1 Tax=Streptomyces viridosporus TaxID=67581 RepID=UPI00117D3FF4
RARRRAAQAFDEALDDAELVAARLRARPRGGGGGGTAETSSRALLVARSTAGGRYGSGRLPIAMD